MMSCFFLKSIPSSILGSLFLRLTRRSLISLAVREKVRSRLDTRGGLGLDIRGGLGLDTKDGLGLLLTEEEELLLVLRVS
mgnify:CR=1 FL=1